MKVVMSQWFIFCFRRDWVCLGFLLVVGPSTVLRTGPFLFRLAIFLTGGVVLFRFWGCLDFECFWKLRSC